MVGQCQHCGFQFDLRKITCPQCSVKHKPSKKDLQDEEDFDISPLEKTMDKSGAGTEVIELTSPSIDRQGSVKKQIELAEEKKQILLQQKELVSLEARLEKINEENAVIERELKALLVGREKAAGGQQPASAWQDGGASGKDKNKPVGVVNTGITGINDQPDQKQVHLQQYLCWGNQQPQLFYADGSPFVPQPGLNAAAADPSMTTSTLQAGLESVGLGLQALGLSGTATTGSGN